MTKTHLEGYDIDCKGCNQTADLGEGCEPPDHGLNGKAVE